MLKAGLIRSMLRKDAFQVMQLVKDSLAAGRMKCSIGEIGVELLFRIPLIAWMPACISIQKKELGFHLVD